MGEPSIIERNARIIKWLIKCRNVPAPIPTSGSTGQLMKLASSSNTMTGSTASIPVRTTVLATSISNPSKLAAAAAAGVTAAAAPPASPLFYGQSTRL